MRTCNSCGDTKPLVCFGGSEFPRRQCNNCIKERQFKHTYGITIKQFKAKARKQRNRCAICKEVKRLVPDHNHGNDQLRDALCNRCNVAVGFYESDLHNAFLAYIEKWNI